MVELLLVYDVPFVPSCMFVAVLFATHSLKLIHGGVSSVFQHLLNNKLRTARMASRRAPSRVSCIVTVFTC